MPLLHCKNCHHEYESVSDDEKCDWCGGESYTLDEKTYLERALVMNHYWNYRVVRHKSRTVTFSNGEEIESGDYYEIHEVHYNPDGSIYGMTKHSVAPLSEDPEQLKSVLDLMRKACDKPILDDDMDFAKYQDE